MSKIIEQGLKDTWSCGHDRLTISIEDYEKKSKTKTVYLEDNNDGTIMGAYLLIGDYDECLKFVNKYMKKTDPKNINLFDLFDFPKTKFGKNVSDKIKKRFVKN